VTRPLGRREQKKLAIREALIAAALRLFREKGYDATTVEEIAALAGVSRRTLFRYFSNKESLVLPRRAEQLERFRRLLLPSKPGEPAYDSIRRACLAIGEEFMAHREETIEQQRIIEQSAVLVAYGFQLDLDWEQAIMERFLLNRLQDEQIVFQARLFAGIILGAIRATLRHWYEAEGCIDLLALGREGLDWINPLVTIGSEGKD
jgi:AcrR family transcriptional regulator